MRHTLALRLWQAFFIVGGAGFVVLASIVLPRYVVEFGLVVPPLLVVAFACVVVLFVMPVEILPAFALTVFVLVPARILPQDGPFGAIPITTAILCVWGFRRLFLATRYGPDSPTGRFRLPWDFGKSAETESSPYKTTAIVAGVVFLLWSATVLFRSVDLQTSAGWTISFMAGALLPLIIGHSAKEAEWIRRTWLFFGALMGVYAVGEAAIQANPLYGQLYAILGATDSQHWSVYRSEASFGHPLFAALFFAVACSLGIGTWLTSNSKWTLTASILAGLGLVVTVSRGALLGGAVAVTFAVLAAMIIRGEKRWNRFALLGVLAVGGVIGLFQFDAFSARSDSSEAELSSQARDLGLWVTLKAAEYTQWLGSGPGTSGITGRLFDDVVIENSLFQLIISLGLPGLILFTVMMTGAFLHALKRHSIGPAAGLLAYAICISGFNALDALRPMHLLLGCLLILTLNSRREDLPPLPELKNPPRKVRALAPTGAR